MSPLARAWELRPVRYVVVGGLSFVLNFALFLVGVHLLGLDVRVAELGARAAGAVATFYGHRRFTFPAEQRAISPLGQGAGYLLLSLLNLAISPWLVWGLDRVLDPVELAKLLSEATITVESYLLTSLLFRARTP